MVYGNGGVALAGESHRFGFEQVLAVWPASTPSTPSSDWSAKLEYNYLNFGPRDVM
jgi:hypothetical protein